MPEEGLKSGGGGEGHLCSVAKFDSVIKKLIKYKIYFEEKGVVLYHFTKNRREG